MWYKASDYQADDYEEALVWAPGWARPSVARYTTAATTDGRGNDVSEHKGWLLNSVGAFYEDFGYFGETDLLYYGINAVQYVFPSCVIHPILETACNISNDCYQYYDCRGSHSI